MSKIQYQTGSSGDKDIYRKIESPIHVVQNGWDDIGSSLEGYFAIISKANQSIDIVNYIDTKLELSYVPSNSGWNYKAFCPFHKNGNERTPSFFINKNDNRYFCQACGINGGVVEYISKTYNRPLIAVAEHILQVISGKIDVVNENLESINKRKKINNTILNMSDLHRKFIKQNSDKEGIEYIMKIMRGFDLVYIYNSEKVEDNIDDIFEHFKMYINKY